MIQRIIHLFQPILENVKKIPKHLHTLKPFFEKLYHQCKSFLKAHPDIMHMQKRWLHAGATLCLLLCLCLSSFLSSNHPANATNNPNQGEHEVLSLIDTPLSIVKNHLNKTTQSYDTYTENGIKEYLKKEELANTSTGTRYVSGYCVNFRSEPDLESEVIDKLYRNTKLELLNECVGDFCRVQYKDAIGYMHKDYLSETEIKVYTPPKVDYSHIGNLRERIATIAKNNQGTQPCISGYCAKWVSGIYQAAGIGYPGGHAIDYWTRWGSTGSTSLDNIPVGAVVVGSGSGSELASQYGHVGIYIGNGMVADNVGYHRIISIWDWANANTGYCQGYHGYIGWVWPYGQPL